MAAPPGEQRAFASFASQMHSPPLSRVSQGQTVAEMDSTHGDGWNNQWWGCVGRRLEVWKEGLELGLVGVG